jgi:anthranilate synthase component I
MKDNPKAENHLKLAIGHLDPMSIFAYLQTMSCESFFVECSAASTTVIGVGPFETLRDVGGKTERIFKGHSQTLATPFFKVLETQLQDLKAQEPVETPFQNGGIFGCIGYDSIAEIEPRLKNYGYFKNESLMSLTQVMVARQLIVFDHKKEILHLIAAKAANTPFAIANLERIINEAPPFSSDLSEPETAEINNQRLMPTLGFDEFKKRISKIKNHILKGDIFQAVLSEKFKCHTTAPPFEIFKMLRQTSPAPYSFYFNLGLKKFFGASPEAFVRVDGRHVHTNPIAGTRPRGQTPKHDQQLERQLTRSTKEGAEHLMLVDLARNDLGRVAQPGSVHVKSFREIHRFSNVMHLVSEVDALLAKQMTALDAFKACFPAGTLSGAPKIRAMEILSELEPEPRGHYGGAIVAFDSVGGLDSCIAIRSLEMHDQIAVLKAGAGVVADSKAENEYAEIINKTKLFRLAIAAAEKKMAQAKSDFSQGVLP